MEKNPFEERMSKLEDAELFLVLRMEKDYQPEAVQAARAEIAKRGIEEEEISEEITDFANARTPLPFYSVVLCLIGSITLVPWFWAIKFRSGGYWRKYRTARTMTKYGLLLYLAFYGLHLNFSPNPVTPTDIKNYVTRMFR